jgi:hypothetical protein
MLRKIYHDVGRARDRSSLESYHEFLSEGADLRACTERLFTFLENYQLVRYRSVEVVEKSCLSAADGSFSGRLDDSLEVNGQRIRSFLEELRQEGVEYLTDLESLPQGYQSKTLHTLTHLLDGFFGIDSHFYNLIEESHGVSARLKKKIKSDPDGYMLLALRAST